MMILVTGGAASGKSEVAESLCGEGGVKYYIAAMRPFGEEAEARIKRHHALRAGKGFTTIERYTDLAGLKLEARGTAIVECVANLTANEMFDKDGAVSDPTARVIDGVAALRAQCERLIVVTDEIGADGVRYDAATEAYIAALGRINAALAASADTVIEVVAGIPIGIKGELPV